MGLFSFSGFVDRLKWAVGNNLDNDPKDVMTTKSNLSHAGYFNDDTDNGFITKNLDTGIRKFQRDNDLKEDGKLFPAGETERTIFGKLERHDPSDIFGNDNDNSDDASIGFGGDVLGTLRSQLSKKDNKDSSRQKIEFRHAFAKEDNPKSPMFTLMSSEEGASKETSTATSSNNSKTPDSEPVQYDATGRMISSKNTPPVPDRKPLDSPYRPPILEGMDNDEVKSEITAHEQTRLFLYKDTAKNGGKVTIGTGLMLPDAEAAKQLPFTVPDGKEKRRAATFEEIEQAFDKVNVIKNDNFAADSFKPGEGKLAKDHGLDDLQLSDEEADRLLDERLRSDVNRLRKVFPKFDKFPSEAQKNLLDMQYNLGSTKFVESRIVKGKEAGWPKLFNAVRNQQWDGVARESKRGGIGNQRNKITYDGFIKANKNIRKK